MIFIHPQPGADEISEMYDKDYFTSEDVSIRPHGRADYLASVTSAQEAKVYQRRLELVAGFAEQGAMLEIGCGPGHFLKAAHDAGWRATGIEISDFAAQYARREFSLQVYTGTLDTVTLAVKSFDVVFMGDLLEHLTNPRTALLQIRTILKPDGIILIEVPAMTNGFYSRIGSFAMRLMGRTKFINLPPYHLFEFNPINIKNLLKIAGFDLTCLRQSAVSPRDVGLHDSSGLNAAKVILQASNHLATKLTGRFGDRLTIIARPTQ